MNKVGSGLKKAGQSLENLVGEKAYKGISWAVPIFPNREKSKRRIQNYEKNGIEHLRNEINKRVTIDQSVPQSTMTEMDELLDLYLDDKVDKFSGASAWAGYMNTLTHTTYAIKFLAEPTVVGKLAIKPIESLSHILTFMGMNYERKQHDQKAGGYLLNQFMKLSVLEALDWIPGSSAVSWLWNLPNLYVQTVDGMAARNASAEEFGNYIHQLSNSNEYDAPQKQRLGELRDLVVDITLNYR